MPADQQLKDQIVEEYIKCADNPEYFLRNYVYIQHQELGRILFDLYDFQERSLKEIRSNRYNIILKARQMGISTLVAAYSLWMALFNNETKILVVSMKRDVAKNLVQKAKFAHDNLPVWMREEKVEDNKTSIGLSNGSKIFAESTSGDAGRSESLSMLIIDEAAFIDDVEELWSAAKPTLDVGNGRAIVLSCVTKDTFVYTESGLRQVGDFVDQNKNGSYEVEPYSILGRDKTRKGSLFKNNGKQKIKKIKNSYTELKGTLNHKVYAYSNGDYGWSKLEDIERGDYVAIQYGKEVFGDNDVLNIDYSKSSNVRNEFRPEHVTDELAYFFGLFIAEGSSYKVEKNGTLQGGNVTIAFSDDISWLFESLELPFYERDGGTHYSVSSKNLIELLEGVGFDLSLKTPDKKVPRKLCSLSKRKTKFLLRGLFDGDGFSQSDVGNVGFSSSSDKLINQMRMLLLNFGIVSKKYTKTKEELNSHLPYENFYDKFSTSNNTLRLDKFNSKKFYEKIKFGLERKQKNKTILKDANFDRAVSHDVIPSSRKLVDKLYSYYDKKTWSLSKYHGIHLNSIVTGPEEERTENVSRKKIRKLYNLVKDDVPNELEKEVEKIVDENIRWVEVKDIEYDYEETYDFSLPETEDHWCHSVIYNGIVGHQTPKNVGSWFHKQWSQAISGSEKLGGKDDIWKGPGTNNFHPIKLHWSLHPNRDTEWRQEQDTTLGPDKAARECDCSFSSSGDNVVDIGVLEWYEENTVEEPNEKRLVRGSDDLWVWEEPEPSGNYVLSADVARGDGDDFSTFHVFSVEDLDQKMEFQGKITPETFANQIYTQASYYNDALVVVERNSFGRSVLQELIDRGYRNILYTSNDLSLVDIRKTRDINEGRKTKPGLDTNRKTRPLIISRMKEFMRNKHCNIKSSRLIEEFRTFVWKGDKPQHMPGYNDDLVMAAAFGIWVRDSALKYQDQLNDVTKKTLERFSTGKGLYTSKGKSEDPYTVRQDGKKHDIRWLFE